MKLYCYTFENGKISIVENRITCFYKTGTCILNEESAYNIMYANTHISELPLFHSFKKLSVIEMKKIWERIERDYCR